MHVRKLNSVIAAVMVTSLASFASLTANAATTNHVISPAAAFAAKATSYQNSTIAKALKNNPAGKRISPSKVEWNNGSVIMAVPAGPDDSSPPCPSTTFTHWTCVYNQTNWNGTQLEFKDQGFYQDLYAYGGSGWRTNSYDNELRQRTWLNQRESHTSSGITLCMSPQATSADSAGPWSPDRWIYLSTNGAGC